MQLWQHPRRDRTVALKTGMPGGHDYRRGLSFPLSGNHYCVAFPFFVATFPPFTWLSLQRDGPFDVVFPLDWTGAMAYASSSGKPRVGI